MYTYTVVIKEINNPYTLHRTITTTGDINYVKNHFGLDNYDVEWYTITKEEENDND